MLRWHDGTAIISILIVVLVGGDEKTPSMFGENPRKIWKSWGSRVVLPCELPGNKSFTNNVRWFHLHDQIRNPVSSEGSILELDNLTPETEGFYECLNVNGPVSSLIHVIGVVEDVPENFVNASSLTGNEEEKIPLSFVTSSPVHIVSTGTNVSSLTPLIGANVSLEEKVPEILSDFPPQRFLFQGDDLELICEATGMPGLKVRWLKDGTEVKMALTNVSLISTARIHIVNITKAAEGNYSCIAINNVLTESSAMTEKHLRVYVVEPTGVTISRPMDDGDGAIVVVDGGDKLKLPCNINPDPENRILSVSWEKDGLPVMGSSVDFGMDGSLTFPNLQKNHSGNYGCVVKTDYDVAIANVSVKVVVNAPVITAHTELVTATFSGENLTLRCLAEGSPSPEISWSFNNTPTYKTGSHFEIVSPVPSADHGLYTCIARNPYGETKREMLLHILTLPHWRRIHSVDPGGHLELSCMEDDLVKTGVDVDFIWKYNHIKIPDKGGNRLLLTNFRPENQSGLYSCEVILRIANKTRSKKILTTWVLLPKHSSSIPNNTNLLKCVDEETSRYSNITIVSIERLNKNRIRISWDYLAPFIMNLTSEDIIFDLCYDSVLLTLWSNASTPLYKEKLFPPNKVANITFEDLNKDVLHYLSVSLLTSATNGSSKTRVLATTPTKSFLLSSLPYAELSSFERKDEKNPLDLAVKDYGLVLGLVAVACFIALLLGVCAVVSLGRFCRRRGDQGAVADERQQHHLRLSCCSVGQRCRSSDLDDSARYYGKTDFNGFDRNAYQASIIVPTPSTAGTIAIKNRTPEWPEPAERAPFLAPRNSTVSTFGVGAPPQLVRSQSTDAKGSISSSWSSLFNVPAAADSIFSSRHNCKCDPT